MTEEIGLELVNEYGEASLRVTLGGRSAMLSANELDRLIETLGFVRTDLLPPPDMTVSRSDRYAVETNTDWHVHQNPLFDGVLLFLRHTGFGWTGFGLPSGEMDLFMEAMTAPSDRKVVGARN
jgi:hypothetical protein